MLYLIQEVVGGLGGWAPTFGCLRTCVLVLASASELDPIDALHVLTQARFDRLRTVVTIRLAI